MSGKKPLWRGASVAPADPLSPEGRALIAASQAALEEVYPPDECFSFSPEELAARETHFYIAQRDGQAVGCVAAADAVDGYTEIKRLFLRPDARGAGLANALMARLEADARARGIIWARLETGPALRAAVALYHKRGYTPCAAFGGYPDIASNLFMEKRLLPG